MARLCLLVLTTCCRPTGASVRVGLGEESVGVRPFLPYPGYNGPLLVSEKSWVSIAGDFNQSLHYGFTGVDARCNGSNKTPSDGCIIAVHAGTHCTPVDPPAQHLWNHTSLPPLADPWSSTRYVVDENGSKHASRTCRHIDTGLRLSDLKGHALTVTDWDGVHISCSIVISSCRVVFGVCLMNWALGLAVAAAFLAVVISMVLVRRHMRENKHKTLRTYTVRILLMVPIYALQAVTALAFKVAPEIAEVLHFGREMYEAIVIFSFLQFVLVCCGGPRSLTESSGGDSAPRQLKHLPGFQQLFPAWRSPGQMLRWCVTGALVYVIVGVVTAVTGLIAAWFVSDEAFEPIAKVSGGLLSTTSLIAILSLAELADNLLEDLSQLRPIGKFLSVKIVVFFTLWQGYVLKYLVYLNFFEHYRDEAHGWVDEKQLSEGVQNFLICIEMCLAAVAHIYVFPADDYKIVRSRISRTVDAHAYSLEPQTALAARMAVVDLRDIIYTVRGIVATDMSISLAPQEGGAPGAELLVATEHGTLHRDGQEGTVASTGEVPLASLGAVQSRPPPSG